MTGWQYFATRLHGDGTESIIGTDIPFTDAEPRRTLSGPDDFGSPTLPVEFARFRGEDGRPLFLPWSTAVYAEKDGIIRAGGIVTDREAEGQRLSLVVEGFTAYPHGMPFGGRENYVQADPLDIVRDIWGHLQAQPGGDLGMTVDGVSSPVRIGTEKDDEDESAGPFRLNYFSTHDLGRTIDDLAEDTPFDYAEEHFWDGGTVGHRLRLGYPTLGRRRHDLRFVVGENVSEPSVGVSDDYASEVLFLGAGEGSKMVNAQALRETGRLRRVAVVSDDTVTSGKRAQSLAERELAVRLGEDDVAQVEVLPHENAPIGAWSVGDEIRLLGSGSGWAGDLDIWVRVLDYTYATATDSVTVSVRRAERV